MTVISMEGEVKSGTERVLRWAWRSSIALLVVLLLVLAWLVASGKLYAPGSTLGYNLGLAGGLLMVAMLIYPLRKRVRFLAWLGRMESWFKFHMMAGIGGPILILFHSSFKIGSMNGRVALYAMLLVAFSGVVGRFLYRHLHRGLYGRQLTLADAESDLKASVASLDSVFVLQPDIELRLRAFYEENFAPLDSVTLRVWRFITLRWRSRHLAREIRRDSKLALKRLGREKRIPRSELIISHKLAREQVDRYLDAVVRSSQFAGWERLFSLWHVVHIPFLYLLLFSGIVHVIAVHMY
jgi:hypothetical protein